MIRKGRTYHRDSKLTFREVGTVYTRSGEREWDAEGRPMHAGEVVIVPFSKCPHVMDKIRVDKWEDENGNAEYHIQVVARIHDPALTDEYIPAFTTRTNAGYFPPRKARKDAPYRHVEYRDEDGEKDTVWTNDYYTLKSYWVEDGVVYTCIEYILPEHAQRILRQERKARV